MRSLYRMGMTALLSGMMLLASVPQQAWTQVFFDNPRTFTVTTACNATSSIRTGANPVPLTVGQTYTALGENRRPGGTHAFIDVSGQRKWVALTCGQLQASPGDMSGAGGRTGGSETTFLPFFDRDDNPVRLRVGGRVDITPPPPQLDNFDRAVNKVCGAPGTEVSPAAFKAMMRHHSGVLQAVMTFTEGRVYGGRPAASSPDAFLDDLTDAWFKLGGFEHIFCGEPVRGGRIGGLHFHGRYWELQEKQLAGRVPNNTAREEVKAGSVYTLGVRMRVANGFAQSSAKSYGYMLSAADILKAATQAFAVNPTRGARNAACLLGIRDDGQTFTTVFVWQKMGIRTFYSDATPSDRNPDCAGSPVSLNRG